ncbi:MAG: hypothetical protein JO218_19820 [Burkholderiales bacterium]|nr:hypothetical protein [Burkholderiales bacterium]
MNEINDLLFFASVVEHKGFSAAATRFDLFGRSVVEAVTETQVISLDTRDRTKLGCGLLSYFHHTTNQTLV